ncbi:anhydro-N-acetylmuramic acid kinase [bacterium]|nr:anhydro-N-acetylmuramic acid kinase [bacterium]
MSISLSEPPSIRLIAGCMTGTSIDGLDVALVRITGQGLAMKVTVLNCLEVELGDLVIPLKRLSLQQPMKAEEITRIARDFGLLHLKALGELAGDNKLDLVSIHGQTVLHKPPLSWQLINPSVIAYGLDIPVVYDLRAADLTKGGEGAPITPLADFILFRNDRETRGIVNLGGFCNVTLLPPCPEEDDLSTVSTCIDNIAGMDICSCNQLLDRIADKLFGEPYDDNGLHAAKGKVLSEGFETLLRMLSDQANEKRSLGTGDELEEWLHKYSSGHSAADIARTACAAIAQAIVNSCQPVDRLIIAGDGVKNSILMNEIRNRAVVPVVLSDDYDIPFMFREAVAMAVLGALCQDRIPITLPQVTGVDIAPVSGCWIIP